VAVDRLKRLTALIARRAETEHQRLVGTTVGVIIDELAPADDTDVTALGRTEGQAPEGDGVTCIEGDLPPGVGPGDLARVTMTDAVGHDLIGRCDAGEHGTGRSHAS
jgi:tRNA A37 methylthiotransferase MiaB